MTPAAARRALRALADGVPPPGDPDRWLTVGQSAVLAELAVDLDAVAAGDFHGLLLVGDPGSGKSQLLRSVRRAAVERGFAIAYVAHDPASHLGFNRPDRIYRRLVETLRLPPGADDRADPLDTLLDRWTDVALPRLVGTPRSPAIAFRLSAAGLLPRETRGIPARTRLALVGLLIATEQRDEDARREFANVLRGVGLTNTELVRLAHRLDFEPGHVGWTPTAYDARHHFGQLRALVFIVRALGYPGVVVLFDEAATLAELAPRSRAKACRVLDGLLFNEYQYQGLYWVFAYTPAFLDRLFADPVRLDGDPSADSAQVPIGRWRQLWRGRAREIVPLNRAQMLALVEQMAHLHGTARGWTAWPGVVADAQRLVAACLDEGLPTRDLVRRGVALLERRYAESVGSGAAPG